MGARVDMDAYMRGCQRLENWELSQMGGVKRRRGMRRFAECGEGAVVIPFVYSYSGEGNRFLVVLEQGRLRVLGMDGKEEASFNTTLQPEEVRHLQINALMLLCTGNHAPMALEVDDEMNWSLREYEIEEPAWRHENEKRDTRISVTRKKNGYTVEFDEEEEEGEREVDEEGDELRVSFWTEQKEAKGTTEGLVKGVRIVTELSSCNEGERVAMKGEETRTYWVCKQEFPAEVYREGLDDPENYPDNFEKADNVGNFEGAREVTSVHELGRVAEGTKFCMLSGYWEYYTCIKEFNGIDMVEGATKFSDYPGHFVRGLAVGEALPCRGAWNFYCTGLWYGSYEVRKNYESAELDGEWETCGISFSRLGSGSNDQLSGDEGEEECYLRLFLTRSRWMNGGEVRSGFPPESCGNRLIVPGFRYDMRLRYVGDDEETGEPLYECVNDVEVEWTGRRSVENWSWKAWSERYGYPVVAAVCQQRLCFAGTYEQPQTIWMSRTDDITNFAVGDTDDSAIVKTLYSSSQNPICWMGEMRNQLVVGTAEAEWTIGAGNEAMTPSRSPATRHSTTGSMEGEVAVQAAEKILFVERGSGRVYEWGYNFEIDGYRAKDLTALAPHILRDHGGAVAATLVRKPDTVAVYALGDGEVALCTYNNFHEVNAWHRWVTEGKVRWVCAMPDGERNDRLFLVVEREGKSRLEVVDADSPYVDDGKRDYVSELMTNALNNPLEELVKKGPKRPVMVKLGAICNRRLLEIAVEGTGYTGIAKEGRFLEEGWNELLPENTWRFENTVGLRFHGSEGCHILALQG